MRKTAAFLIGAWLVLAAGLPPEVKKASREGLLHTAGAKEGWESPQRVPLAYVREGLRLAYGRGVKTIWAISDPEGRLAAYGVDLEAPPYEKNTFHGIPPVRSVILSASLEEPAFTAAFSVPIESLFSCPQPEQLVLVRKFALVSRCGDSWRLGREKLTASWVRRFAYRSPLKAKPGPVKVSRTWDALLRAEASSSGVIVMPEFDAVWPIDHNATWGIKGITPSENHNCGAYKYYNFTGSVIVLGGVMASAARLIWKGEKYTFKPAVVQYEERGSPAPKEINYWEPTHTFYCVHWVPAGVMTDYPEMTCEKESKVNPLWWSGYLTPIARKTIIPYDYWKFAERNAEVYKSSRRYTTTWASIFVPLFNSYGRFVYENSVRPPFVRDIGREAARPLWYRYFKERLLKRALFVEAAYEGVTPAGYPGFVAPGPLPAGWDDAKSLIAVFAPEGWWVIGGPSGGYIIPPGYTWIAPELLGTGPPGWVYPPSEFVNSPPAVSFPTRVIVREGEEFTLKADTHWDREGEKITWEVEDSPFTVVEKKDWSLTLLADLPENHYVVWIKYTDGRRAVHHPVVVYVAPTYKFGEGK